MQDLKASFVIPKRLKWSDPDPCQWSHVICSDDGQVTNIELQDQNRKGTVPPILKKLSSMAVMYLENNQLRGPIPSLVGPFADISNLSTLEDLSLGHNKLTDDPGLACDSRVNILLSIAESMGYPEVLAESRKGNDPCPTYKYWKGISCDIGGNITENVVVITDGNPDVEKESNSPGSPPGSGSKIQILGITLGSVIGDFCGLFVVGLGVFLYIRNKKSSETVPIQVLRPRICGISVVHSVDFGDMAIPIQVLRNATNNFSEENRLGRGGVGTVYKGELKDGTEVGVKRMELGSVTEQGIAQFESEITVLTKGTLGRHLFNWEEEGLEPLEWNTRLNIALDVARGDDMRVADFGLVRLVPENGKHSILTKVAGTFGYLAPEYIGRKVVDATHSDPEYIIHLATWFQKMHKNHDTFQMAIDKTIQLDEENLANVSTVAELGDHCCANEP
ncbi:Receptor protein kinase TMK1 [Citrus sinensis]|uniref:Receptor protein kinase TMK1 n=1 Tax=Citrus sinensis TaxID=2711 RepID=A0ACB8N9X8_CITSI|nr:Receptor protein kinase TMK1 [Citrus sinensis]